MKELKDRIDDALGATKAAVEEGIVAGGGVALLDCISALEELEIDNADQRLGVRILKKVLRAPAEQIIKNSGLDEENIVDNVIRHGYPDGFNCKTENYENMIKVGVIDPKKVTRVALESAASVAGLILTSEVTISDLGDESK